MTEYKTKPPVFEYKGNFVLQTGFVFYIQKNSKGRIEVSRNLNLTNPFWVNPKNLKEIRSIAVVIKSGEYIKKELEWILSNYTELNDYQKINVKESRKIVEESEKIKEYRDGRCQIVTVPNIIKRKIEQFKAYYKKINKKITRNLKSIYYKTIRLYWRNVGRTRIIIKKINQRSPSQN